MTILFSLETVACKTAPDGFLIGSTSEIANDTIVIIAAVIGLISASDIYFEIQTNVSKPKCMSVHVYIQHYDTQFTGFQKLR